MAQAEKVQRLLVDSGEQVHSAAIAFRPGAAQVYLVAGGLVGAALAMGQKFPQNSRALALPDRVIVALTDRRLLVYSLGGVIVAAPKKILHAFDRDNVVGLEQPVMEGHGAAVLRASILIRGGEVLRIEFPVLSHDEGARIIEGLTRGLS